MTPQIGTGIAGTDAERVQVSTVLGDRDGPVGSAWSSALVSPSIGHSPFVVVARPGLPVVPLTLMVPAVGVADHDHARLTMGAAQAGVAAAVLDLQMDDPDGLMCLVASVWVDPKAVDEDAVYTNTRDAAIDALKQGASGGPWHGHLVEVDGPSNDHYRRTSG